MADRYPRRRRIHHADDEVNLLERNFQRFQNLHPSRGRPPAARNASMESRSGAMDVSVLSMRCRAMSIGPHLKATVLGSPPASTKESTYARDRWRE